ncbi:metallophosphoesterase [Blastococcus sp. URHD0036]|uniref:metallophosphoesterase family protein n=1 Tax=Blastococcus sp. URHD0036 TaxID=1380356 RepID=UPI00068AE62E|nr:metallophosphoesterase [Blastococcus sp. URHD0036]
MSDPADAPDAGDPTSAAADAAEESESPAHDGRARLGRVVRRTGRWGLCVLVALTGAVIGVLLLGRTSAPLGPFDARFSVSPTGGGVALDIPPLGALDVDAYDGPFGLDVQLQRADEARIQALVDDPRRFDSLVDRITDDLGDAVTHLVVRAALGAVGGAVLLTFAVYRLRWREPVVAAGTVVVILAGTAGLGAATWRPDALAQPTYTGLLANAPSLIGDAQDIVARFDAYRASLEDLVGNVSTLYATLSALPAPGGSSETVAVLHVSDLHLNPAGFDLVDQVVDQFGVDAVLDTGDITDWGSEPENRAIASIGGLGVPYVYIRGNHDSATTAALVASQPNATVLDDTATTVAGLTVVGAPDPRFTPDQEATGDTESLEQTGEELAEVAEQQPERPDIAMVHDPKQAPPLDGVVPLVLAGHTHERDVSTLDEGTRLMVQGSTGGAGLRGLQGDYPEPLTCTVLYFDRSTGRLTGYDDITLGGLGETEVTIVRTLVGPEDTDETDSGTDEGTGGGTGGGTSTAPTSPGG